MTTIEFIKQFPKRSFRKGEQIVSEGDAASTFFAIQTGYIKVTSLNSDGSERLLWIAGRYDLAPTEQLFSTRGKITFFYTALTDGSAYMIDKKTFLAYAKTSLELMFEIAASMSGHYDDLLQRLNSVEQNVIHSKLIYTLAHLGERFSADSSVDMYQLGLRLTHQDIADMIGATRETTSPELQKLRAKQLIDYSRTSFIVHVDKLREEMN